MISNSGSDERGQYSGGKAGDQTGKEWQIRSWYDRPWNYVLRYPSSTVRECIAELAEEAANNDKIGYDQGQRTTFWQQLREVGYHPKDIKVACEADCSSGVAAIVKATGYLLGIPSLQNVSVDMYTGSERNMLKKAGFQVLTDPKYLTSDKYLLRGDILLYEGHHTAINLTDGSATKDGGWHWVHVGNDWYYQDNDGVNTYGWKVINHHWYSFDNRGKMRTGVYHEGDDIYYLMESGDLEGACCKTDDRGVLYPWYV